MQVLAVGVKCAGCGHCGRVVGCAAWACAACGLIGDTVRDTTGPVAVRFRDLPTGCRFWFQEPHRGTEPLCGVYEARGNGWYGTPHGYDGGPWYVEPGADPVVLVAAA